MTGQDLNWLFWVGETFRVWPKQKTLATTFTDIDQHFTNSTLGQVVVVVEVVSVVVT